MLAQAAWAALALLSMVLGILVYLRSGSPVTAAVAVLLVVKVAAIIYALAGLDIRLLSLYIINKKTHAVRELGITAAHVIILSNTVTLAAILYNRQKRRGLLE